MHERERTCLPRRLACRPTFAQVLLLAFDIFGTVVNWHGSIAREVRSLYPEVDAEAYGCLTCHRSRLRW